MTSKTKLTIALAATAALGLTLAGCGENSLHAMPENASYVAPPSPGVMKIPPKQKKGRHRGGVPLGFSPGASPLDGGRTA